MRTPTTALLTILILGWSTISSADPGGDVELTLDPDGGPHRLIRFGNDDALIGIGGLLQTEALIYLGDDAHPDNGAPAASEGFRIRRARIHIEGRFLRIIQAVVETEMSSDLDINLLDAWAAWNPVSFFGVKTGLFKVPWDRSTQLHAGLQIAPTRPLAVRAMAPYRQLGAAAEFRAWKQKVRIHVGVFNALDLRRNVVDATTGGDAGVHFHRGYDQASGALLTRDPGFMYVARFDISPFGRLGPHAFDPDQGPVGMNFGAGYFYSDGPGLKIHGVSADVHLKARGFAMLAGYLLDVAEPLASRASVIPGLSDDFMRQAAYLDLSYVILPNLLGVHARVEYLDPDMESAENDRPDRPDPEEIIMGAGLDIWAMRDLLAFRVHYQHRWALTGEGRRVDAIYTQVQVVF